MFVDVVGIYFKSYPGHDDNSNQIPDTRKPNAKALAFLNLVDQERQLLYASWKNISLLEATLTLLYIKSQRNVTILAYEDIATLKSWLPANNKFSDSLFPASKRLLKKSG